MHRIIRTLASLLSVAALCGFVIACGGESETQQSTTTSAPAASAPKKPAASVEQISAEAKQCLDLVKAKRYADAIDPCKRALDDTANADVQQAYNEAKAAVQKEAQAAGVQAASDSLSGKPADEAAKDAAASALGNLGGGGSE